MSFQNRIANLQIRLANLQRQAGGKDQRTVDVHMARDISMTLCNDSRFHKRLLRMLKGIANHMAKGQYQEGGALTQCENIVNAYLPTYKKDNRMSNLRVNKATKELAAKEILEDQMEIIEEMAEKIKKTSKR